MIKKFVWRFLAFYLLAIVFAFISFPSSISYAVKTGHPEAPLIAPLLLPVVARSYTQIAKAGVWPFARDEEVVSLSNLIDEKGRVNPGGQTISFNMTTSVPLGNDGRLTYSLGKEMYNFRASGGIVEVLPSGLVVRIGQYFCLSDRIKHILEGVSAKVTCVRVIRKGADIYEWQELGQAKGRIAALEP